MLKGRIGHALNTAVIVTALLSGFTHNVNAELEFRDYLGTHSGISERAVLIMGQNDAVLIDALWTLADGRTLADEIAKSGRNLTHILITHGHPDHHWGIAPILERFPKARVLARQPIVDEIATQFYSKWIHWEAMFGDNIPRDPVVPEVLEGESMQLEGHEIRFIDLEPAETMDATVYYVPSSRVLIPGDLVFAKMHAYFADLNNPGGWIKMLQHVKTAGPIDTVFPGHGPAGGAELLDEAIHYMEVYQSIAKPGIPLGEVVPAMRSAFPEHGGELILWWTRGPGFGIFGPRALGVPEHLLAPLPPALLGDNCPVGNRTLVEKLFYQGFSGGHLDVLDEVMHKDIEFSDPAFPPGLAGIKVLVTKNNASFEHWGFKMHQVLCAANMVTVRWTGTGRHVTSFMGEKPTNQQVTLNGISIYQIENNQITADWVIPDNLGFLMQIGVLAPVDMTVKSPH